MVRTAVCDDDTVFCEKMEEAIHAHLGNTNAEYSVCVYHSAKALQMDFAKGLVIDILFLDIEFAQEQSDGIDLANYIRKELRNDYTEIVYISSQEKYAMKLFDTRPLHFLIKPIRAGEVEDVLDKAARIRITRMKYFTYRYRSKRIRIELGRILYFVSEGRRVHIICKDKKEFLFNGKICEVIQELDTDGFFSPHKSYAVNYYAVEQWGRNDLILCNGDYIPISRNKEATIRSLQLEYERGLF